MIDWEGTLRRVRRDFELGCLTDKETLTEMLNRYETPQRLADILYVSAPSVRNKVKDMGIPIPKWKRFSRLADIEFGDKLPREIAIEAGVTTDHVYRYAKTHNIDTRWKRDPHRGRPWDIEKYWLDDSVDEHKKISAK